MNYILEGFEEAIFLIISGDPEIYRIIGFSLMISLASTLFSLLIGVPLGLMTGIRNFKSKKLFARIIHTLMGLPPVVVGLLVALFLSRQGPLGQFQLMYTATAMIIAQTILVTPIIVGNVFDNCREYGKVAYEVCDTLGGNRSQKLYFLVREMRIGILTGMTAGFGRAISEVGAIMIVGGNIAGHTRVMTTFIAMNTSMGNYGASIAMGLVLFLFAFLLNGCFLYFIEGRES
ncbi:MAG: ABC transporter permease [Lachnospiraceae bacterium]